MLPATLVTLFLLFPLFGDRFYIQFASKIIIMIIFASSLNLLVGYTGLVSLGHAAFFGFSGYVVALLTPVDEPLNFFVALGSSIFFVGVLGAVIGALVLRTKGIFFIMSTLAFGEMLFYFLHDTTLAGGSDGIFISHRPVLRFFDIFQVDLANSIHFYYVTFLSLLLVLILIKSILNSPFGRIIQAIKINENRAQALGYNTYKLKFLCFLVASMIAAFSGFLSAIQFGAVNPEMVGWHVSGHALMMVILGGLGTLAGPILGATTLMLIEEIFQQTTKHWQLFTGLVVIMVALFLPKGLAGVRISRDEPAVKNRGEG